MIVLNMFIMKIPNTRDRKLTGLGGAGTIAGGGGLATAFPPLGSESLKLNCRKNSLVSLRRKRRNILIEKSNCLLVPVGPEALLRLVHFTRGDL